MLDISATSTSRFTICSIRRTIAESITGIPEGTPLAQLTFCFIKLIAELRVSNRSDITFICSVEK